MNIPEHIKRQALDAVASHESTAFIRRHRAVDGSLSKFFSIENAPRDVRPSDTQDVRQRALDAVAGLEARMRPVAYDGRVFPMSTPNLKASKGAEQIVDLHRRGRELDHIHGWATKNDLGRDHV